MDRGCEESDWIGSYICTKETDGVEISDYLFNISENPSTSVEGDFFLVYRWRKF